MIIGVYSSICGIICNRQRATEDNRWDKLSSSRTNQTH